jgi:hypothetical protein
MTIAQHVVEGGGYFLKSHSDILRFLGKIEISELHGVDFNQLQELINSAVTNMENAKYAYIALTQLANVTPYNEEIIRALAAFKYSKFRKLHSLDSFIFRRVRNYLKSGDVRGIYNRMLEDTERILDILYDIQQSIDASEVPEATYLWKLNHECFMSLVFDQYTSMVFYEIAEVNP